MKKQTRSTDCQFSTTLVIKEISEKPISFRVVQGNHVNFGNIPEASSRKIPISFIFCSRKSGQFKVVQGKFQEYTRSEQPENANIFYILFKEIRVVQGSSGQFRVNFRNIPEASSRKIQISFIFYSRKSGQFRVNFRNIPEASSRKIPKSFIFCTFINNLFFAILLTHTHKKKNVLLLGTGFSLLFPN